MIVQADGAFGAATGNARLISNVDVSLERASGDHAKTEVAISSGDSIHTGDGAARIVLTRPTALHSLILGSWVSSATPLARRCLARLTYPTTYSRTHSSKGSALSLILLTLI